MPTQPASPHRHAPAAPRPVRLRRRAFTLLESIFLMTILSIVSLGAGVSLSALAKVPTQNDTILAINGKVIDCMEQMRSTAASNFSGLVAEATSLTNTNPGVLINGKYYSCSVTAAQANPDGSGNKTDFYQVTVTIGSQSMSTYVVQP